MKFIGYTYGLILLLFIIILLISWVIALIKTIVCFRRKNCQIDNCPLREYCNQTAPSPREKARRNETIRNLQAMLDEMDEKSKTGD